MEVNKLILFLILNLFSGILYSQDCRNELKNLLIASRQFDFNKGYNLEYTINLDYGEQGIKSERIKAYGNSTKSVVESTNYQIYQDDSVMVTIILDQKTIFISEKKPETSLTKKMETMFQKQDSIIKSVSEVVCEKSMVNGSETIKFKVVPDPTDGKSKINFIEIEADSKSYEIANSKVYYKEGPYQTMEMIIHKFENSYAKEVFDGKALKRVFSANKLKKEFENYRLVDARKSK
jgi:hypothetical protein